jgi:ABC-type glycerol-3-phosphate transport system permease component
MSSVRRDGPAGGRGRSRRPAVAAAVALIVLTVTPILWVLKMSIVPRMELFASPPRLLPGDLTLSSYRTVFTDPAFRRGLLNSVVIAGATTAACLAAGAPAAYALARLQFRFRGAVMAGILALAFFPAAAVVAPLFIQFKSVGLLNTFAAIVLVDTVFALPLVVWILTAFFRQRPRDLEDAARVDGATILQTFRRVIVPLAAPGVASAAIITFIVAWNEFLFANTFLFDVEHWPATVAIPNFAGLHTVDYGAQAAASLVLTVPLAVVVLACQRRIVAGLTAGALKG